MEKEKRRLRVGAINWDAGLPADTYFGGFALRNLGTPEYCGRLPYYAVKLPEGGWKIPVRSQADYDRELAYAIDCGLDFFAYCWYPDDDQPRIFGNEGYPFLTDHLPELNTARKLYQSSPLNRQIGMCAIVFSTHDYSEADMEALFDAMGQDYYEKIDGKPLVIIFNRYKADFLAELRRRAAKKGFELYIACIHDAKPGELPDFAEADAVTGYAVGGYAESFRGLIDSAEQINCRRLTYGPHVIPVMSAGWNPMPRVTQPCPWVSYGAGPYAGSPDQADLEEGFMRLRAFIAQNPDKADTGRALVFAWNEFEEGGWLCPTLDANGGADDSRLRAFAAARRQGEAE